MTGNGNHTTYKNGDDWGMVYDCLTMFYPHYIIQFFTIYFLCTKQHVSDLLSLGLDFRLFSVDLDVNSCFLKSGTRTICRNGLEAPFCGVRVSTRFHHVRALVNAKTGEQLNHSRGVAQHVPAKCGWIDTRWGLPVISWFINWLIKVYPPENPS